MAKYLVPLANGIYTDSNTQKTGIKNESFYHQVAFTVNGAPTTGVIEIKAKAPDSGQFESIPDGVINLAAPETLLFQFMVEEYEFTISGSDVTDGVIVVSDRELKGVAND